MLILTPKCPPLPPYTPLPRAYNKGDGNSSQAGQTLTGEGADWEDGVSFRDDTCGSENFGYPNDFELITLAPSPEVLIWSTRC
jgi:hypothetical protein